MSRDDATAVDLSTAKMAATHRYEPVTHAYLFHVLTAPQPGRSLGGWDLSDCSEAVIGRAPRAPDRDPDGRRALAVFGDPSDVWMSAHHALLARIASRWWIEDLGSKNGTFVNRVRVGRAALTDGDLIEAGQTTFIFRAAVPHGGPAVGPSDGAFATTRPDLASAFVELRQAARSRLSILLAGETGTGKEMVARAIHALSGRKGAFVAVNCGAIPESLAESELFGHRAGSFTGAAEDRVGLIRSAAGGTLFLDEIGDLPLLSQAALLRVLEHREVLPVGASRAVSVDFRLVVATHQDLRARVRDGDFRDDLHARLLGLELTLPPLRDRREDLSLLIRALLHRHAPERADRITLEPDAMRALVAYDWPENIRELSACLETALVLEPGDMIGTRVLRGAVLDAIREPGTVQVDRPPAVSSSQRRDTLVELLREHHGNVSAVARSMRKDRKQIKRWLAQLQLRADDYRAD